MPQFCWSIFLCVGEWGSSDGFEFVSRQEGSKKETVALRVHGKIVIAG